MIAAMQPSPEPPVDYRTLFAIVCRHLAPDAAARAVNEAMKLVYAEADTVGYATQNRERGIRVDGHFLSLEPLLAAAGLVSDSTGGRPTDCRST